MDASVDEQQDPLDPARLRKTLRGTVRTAATHPQYTIVGIASVFCPACSSDRRMAMQMLYCDKANNDGVAGPTLVRLICMQCEMEGIAVLHEGPQGDTVSLLWPQLGGLSTPNTPTAIAYYLDQAARCETAGASSAAVAMYRAALDHLMFDQGYTDGMLGHRLGKMFADVKAGKGPKWAREIDHAYLDVINKLGGGAIHTNDGDVSKQASLDDEVIAGLHVAFAEILEVVYQRPAKDAAHLAKLQQVASQLKK